MTGCSHSPATAIAARVERDFQTPQRVGGELIRLPSSLPRSPSSPPSPPPTMTTQFDRIYNGLTSELGSE